jgi:hypothetical protein
VEKTGQIISYVPNDDGDLRRGVTRPEPRFKDNGNGTVTDNLTGLIWLKNANCFGYATLALSLSACNTLANGSCGLTDGSNPGDWRLPNRYELESLLNMAYFGPALSNAAGTGHWSEGDPFTNVQSLLPYWSSTTLAANTGGAWHVNVDIGQVSFDVNYIDRFIWPVRGGH